MTIEERKSNYLRNVLALMTGSAVAQALPIAASPILTRLYTPADFGVAALFLATTTVLASVVTGRYELAIGIPESDEDAINIAALGAALTLLVSGSFFILVFFFGKTLAILSNAEALIPWMYLIPLSVLLSGFWNVLNYTNNRLGKFKDMAKANVYKSTAATSTQLLLGLVSKGASGLIAGAIVAQLVSNAKLYRNIQQHHSFNAVSRRRALDMAKRYKNFPKFSMWSGLLNTTAHNALAFFMPVIFGLATLGMYNLATRVLSAPAALISSAIGQVFLREATIERQLYGHAKAVFNKTVVRLALIGAPIFAAIFFFSEPLFGIIFGEAWREAGRYATAIAPLLFTQFVVSTVSMMNVVFEKNHIGFYWQLILAMLSIGLILAAFLWKWSFINYLRLTSLVLTIHYLALLVIMSTYNKQQGGQ